MIEKNTKSNFIEVLSSYIVYDSSNVMPLVKMLTNQELIYNLRFLNKHEVLCISDTNSFISMTDIFQAEVLSRIYKIPYSDIGQTKSIINIPSKRISLVDEVCCDLDITRHILLEHSTGEQLIAELLLNRLFDVEFANYKLIDQFNIDSPTEQLSTAFTTTCYWVALANLLDPDFVTYIRLGFNGIELRRLAKSTIINNKHKLNMSSFHRVTYLRCLRSVELDTLGELLSIAEEVPLLTFTT